MKEKIVLNFSLFILLVNPCISLSQNTITTEFSRLDSLCKIHTRTPDSLLFYSQKLLNFSQKHNLVEGEMNAYKSLGLAYSRLTNYEKSNQYYYKALSFARALDDTRLEHIIYNDLSINHRNTKYYDSAIYYSRKLIKIYQNSKDKRSLNLSYMNLGISYFSKSSLDSAQYYLDKSIKGFNMTKNLMFMTNNLSLLAEVYFQKKEYKQALKIADSSQNIAESSNLQRNIARNYNLLARIHEKLNNQEEYNKYLKLEDENKLKNINSRNIKIGGLNESHQKTIIEHNLNKIKNLLDDKLFYKTSLFKILFVAIGLFFISLFFFRRNRINQKEVSLLREKLKLHAEKNNIEPTNLIYLNNKVVIDSNTVQFIKSDGHYLEFYIEGKDQPEIDRNSLINILDTLPSHLFVRIHKSYIVNITFIKIINSTKLMLKDGTWINLSRTYKKQLKEMLNFN
jgi:tetratricopeptide (TPR) repeat protein